MGGGRGDPPPCIRRRDHYAGRPSLDPSAQWLSRRNVFYSLFHAHPRRENTCVAEVNAQVWDGFVGQPKFRSTERNTRTIAEMWNSTFWVKSTERNLTRAVSEI